MSKIFGFETDTVWGMGCSIEDKNAVEKIYEIKGREHNKPLILMSNDIKNLLKYVQVEFDSLNIIKKYLPGKLTAVLKKSEKCPFYIAEGFETVGVRVPNHKGFWELCKKVEGGVLATTSLNLSHMPPCSSYKEALEVFGDICEIVKPDRETVLQNTPSTVADFTSLPPKVLRQGSVIL